MRGRLGQVVHHDEPACLLDPPEKRDLQVVHGKGHYLAILEG